MVDKISLIDGGRSSKVKSSQVKSSNCPGKWCIIPVQYHGTTRVQLVDVLKLFIFVL